MSLNGFLTSCEVETFKKLVNHVVISSLINDSSGANISIG